MSPEDEIRVLELIADRPVQTLIWIDDDCRLSRRKKRRRDEIRSVVSQMLREHDERTERREKQAVINAVMAHMKSGDA